MPRRLRVVASLLLLGACFACQQASAQANGGPADPVSAWLQSHAHPLVLEAEHFDDLEFLRPLLKGKRIVQLGENTHGIREYNVAKARIVRFLHEELGYEVLAFESALYQCYGANLTAAEAPAFSMTVWSTMISCTIGVWHTEGVLPVFEYLRETQASDRPLHLAGFDVQPIGNNKANRPDFLSNVVAAIDSGYATDVFSLDSTFLKVYALDGGDRRSYFRAEAGQQMIEAYEHLAVFLSDNGAAIQSASTEIGRTQVLVARQTAASMAWYIRAQSAPTTRERFEHRDEGMAENLAFLLDELLPHQKVIVWGHNFHLRHDNFSIPPDSTMFVNVPVRTMGSWIHERYGEEVYTVGLYAYQGQAANNSGEAYEIKPAEPGSLEALLHGTGFAALFIDLSQSPHEPGSSWMDEPTRARHNGTIALQMVLRNQYDAILFIDEVTPRVMLY